MNGKDYQITTESQLREVIGGEPSVSVNAKIHDRVNELTQRFIELSPFVCLATMNADGECDVSPRGDPPGFVRILDDRTLLVPERPGNKIADTLRNILSNSRIAILFVLPGLGETFRVNGSAELTTDPALLAPSAVEGRVPKLGILVHIEEAYTQCPKAFLRSDLWNSAHYVDRSLLASPGEILCSVQRDRGDVPVDPTEYDTARAERYARRDGFY